MATERAYWLAWSRIKNVGPVTIKRLWEHFGALALAWKAPASELLSVDGIGLLIAEQIVSQRSKIRPDQLLHEHEQANQSFWTPADSDYPALLFAINDPPPVLYYRGQLRLNDAPHLLSVGMVGTRRPSAYGKRWTQRISAGLSRRGALIVSGLAAGIDTEAHTSCLQQRGLTVAVLGTGVDVVYPHRNTGLYQRVVEQGLVVSEYPDGTGPDKTHFPQRNRIIAGLSRATLVMEAPARSGALITARLANDYCREVFALPCALDNEVGEGCLRLINEGAQVILGERALVETLEALPGVDVAAVVKAAVAKSDKDLASDAVRLDSIASSVERSSAEPASAASSSDAVAAVPDVPVLPTGPALNAAALAAAMPELSPLLTQVFDAVPVEPTLLDYIVQRSQIETGRVLGALVELELSGLVVQLPGMQYQRA
ncbi:MAG: DNA-processing protein DprA [Cyanobacteria bacterium J06649_4]